ncbi:hypothetical protein Tco_0396996 [Tanacetum coccineum]
MQELIYEEMPNDLESIGLALYLSVLGIGAFMIYIYAVKCYDIIEEEPSDVTYICTCVQSADVPTGRYVVPTGRVIATVSIKVPTGRYIVPAGYIISPGLKDLSRAETYKWYQSLERVSVEE